ncbi:hypothetical protein [Streptomyces sp. NPDC047981]|uniref:hypothetical protein n=1 Tax=Streptomyces sp. NPDC047981 TaxID=3154610 RepID=UPI00343E1DAE
MFDLSEPFRGNVPDRDQDTKVIIAQIPHDVLPLPVGRARRALAVPMEASGVGGVLADLMTSIRGQAGYTDGYLDYAALTIEPELTPELLSRVRPPAEPETSPSTTSLTVNCGWMPH